MVSYVLLNEKGKSRKEYLGNRKDIYNNSNMYKIKSLVIYEESDVVPQRDL